MIIPTQLIFSYTQHNDLTAAPHYLYGLRVIVLDAKIYNSLREIVFLQFLFYIKEEVLSFKKCGKHDCFKRFPEPLGNFSALVT